MNLFTNEQVAKITGCDDLDMDFFIMDADFIQVCAGTWTRLNADLWYFVRDPEWDA